MSFGPVGNTLTHTRTHTRTLTHTYIVHRQFAGGLGDSVAAAAAETKNSSSPVSCRSCTTGRYTRSGGVKEWNWQQNDAQRASEVELQPKTNTNTYTHTDTHTIIHTPNSMRTFAGKRSHSQLMFEWKTVERLPMYARSLFLWYLIALFRFG